MAIILVICTHGGVWGRLGVDNQQVLAVIQGRYGVRPFFVMSGFLITWILLRERLRTGTVDVRKFFMRRAIRIFPLYFLALAFLYVVTRLGYTRISDCTFDYALTYTNNFAPAACTGPATAHLWSLAVEEHFYLFWPFIFLIGRRFALGFAIAFAIASATMGPLVLELFPEARLTRWTFPAAAPIAYGCIAAFVCDSPWVRRIFGPSPWSLILKVALILGIISPAFLNSMTLQYATIALVILFMYHNQDSLLVRTLEIKPLVMIGVLSYGLYIWHGIFMGSGTYRLPHSSFPPSQEIGFLITIIVAPLVYYGFERPILQLKDRFAWQQGTRQMPEGSVAARPVVGD